MQTENNNSFVERPELLCPSTDSIMEEKSEWDKIDDLVEIYQQQFSVTETTREIHLSSDQAAAVLLEKFHPLLKKYVNIVKYGQINFENAEQRQFVALFIDDIKLRKALYSKKDLDRETKASIYYKFNFVVETYGSQDISEINTDLYIIFFTLAKRYKKMKRSFCCYVYNTMRFEVFRKIQSYTKNPANITYRNYSYEELAEANPGFLYEESPEEYLQEDLGFSSLGLPNAEWISGLSCSEAFASLTPLERKILSKYYLENCSDRQISEELKINANIKRRKALEKLAKNVGLSLDDVKRTRKVGSSR